MRLPVSVVMVVLGILVYTQGQRQLCTSLADIYIVLTASDTMVELPQFMRGARNGIRNLFTNTRYHSGTGPQVSVCSYGTTAEEQLVLGQTPSVGNIRMVGGISHLDLGIECARLSSRTNRRPGVRQFMVLIVAEDPLGFEIEDFTEDARQQIEMARREGFERISLTTVTDNVYPEFIEDFADPDYWVHINPDFREFERRTNQGGQNVVDPILWRQFCPEDIRPPTTTTRRPTVVPVAEGLCDDCIIVEGIGYNFFEGDCRKFVQCFFDDRVPPYLITWTAPGTFWDKPQVQQHWPEDVICEWDVCTDRGVGFVGYGDERNCAAYWQCAAGIDGNWRTSKFVCCPDPANEVWDDVNKECRATGSGPGCDDPCPFIRPTFEPTCNKAVRGDPRLYYDLRDPDAEDQACDMGMVFDVEKCTCSGRPVTGRPCAPLFHLDFKGGRITDHSRNKFWIANDGNVVAERDSANNEWYGRFDGDSQLFVPGLSNLDLMSDWAFVVRYDAENLPNRRSALIGSTNCQKKQGSYYMAFNPQNGRLEAFVKTGKQETTREATATINVPTRGLQKAIYLYHNATGLDISVGGTHETADIDGSMWRDDSLCGFHIGWSQELEHFEGRIYEVLVYREPDCIPENL